MTVAVLHRIPFHVKRLAARAVPGAAAGGPDLLDRRAAARARLAGAAGDRELVLHLAAGAVRLAIVSERRALPFDAHAERGADAADEARELCLVEAPSLSARVDPCAPERLVGIDVPDAGERPLVEDRCLHRRLALREPVA